MQLVNTLKGIRLQNEINPLDKYLFTPELFLFYFLSACHLSLPSRTPRLSSFRFAFSGH